MPNYKIIATDLDGTLLNSTSDVSDENTRAISELFRRGVHVVPASGRSYSEMPDKAKNHPDIRYFICSNGAFIYDKKEDVKTSLCIEKSDIKKILDTLNRYEVHITIRHNGKIYADSEFVSEKHFDYYNMFRAHRVVLKSFGVKLDDFDGFCETIDNAEMIAVFFKNYNDWVECRKILERNKNLCVTSGGEYNLEIIEASAGKGSALMRLADMIGVDRLDTIGVGDSDNDISSVSAAGLGLATSNACDSLKEAADKVICSNDEHVIEYILLNCFE